MATVTKQFDTYQIFYYSSYPLDAYYEALIYCYQAGAFVGRMEFYKASTPVASLSSSITGGLPYVKYRIDRFPDVQQILLNEKPLYLFVNDSNGIGMLATAELEPTGAEE